MTDLIKWSQSLTGHIDTVPEAIVFLGFMIFFGLVINGLIRD